MNFSMILCAANMTKWYWNAVGGSVLDGVESDKSFQVNLFDSTLCDFCDTIENRTQIFHRRDAKNNSPCRRFETDATGTIFSEKYAFVRAAKRCSLTRPSHTAHEGPGKPELWWPKASEKIRQVQNVEPA